MDNKSTEDTTTSMDSVKTIDYLENCDYEDLQTLCTTAGMSESGFGKLWNEFSILPGEWWMCYSDDPKSRDTMLANILALLDKGVIKTGGIPSLTVMRMKISPNTF